MNDFKILHTLQPYRVGSKNGSLAIVIPAKVVKKFSIDTSTIFAMEIDEYSRTIVLRIICTVNKVIDTTKEINYRTSKSDAHVQESVEHLS